MSLADTIDAALAPPSQSDLKSALRRFAEAVRARYGSRVRGVHLFGSRARGDFRPESDADVAVVLAGEDWQFWREKMALADLAYDTGLRLGVVIQPWPVSESEWSDPALHSNPSLVRAMKRDARDVENVA